MGPPFEIAASPEGSHVISVRLVGRFGKAHEVRQCIAILERLKPLLSSHRKALAADFGLEEPHKLSLVEQMAAAL